MKHLRFALFGGLCMTAVTLCALLSHTAVPLYDGVGFPDEPYRYASPPSEETRTPLKPGIAQTTVPLSNGTNASDLTVSTRESGPQMLLYFPAQSLHADVGSISVAGAAQAPAKNQLPPHGSLAGNYYHVSLVAHPGTARFTQAAHTVAYIQLRLPQGFPVGAAIRYRASSDSAWRTLGTVRTGSDIYQATFKGSGDYVLSSVPARSSGDYAPAAIAGACVALLGIATLVVTIRRRSKSSPSQSAGAAKRS